MYIIRMLCGHCRVWSHRKRTWGCLWLAGSLKVNINLDCDDPRTWLSFVIMNVDSGTVAESSQNWLRWDCRRKQNC
jgi:hypothetical protein